MNKRAKIQPVKVWAAIVNGKIGMVDSRRADLIYLYGPDIIRVLITPITPKRKAGGK